MFEATTYEWRVPGEASTARVAEALRALMGFTPPAGKQATRVLVRGNHPGIDYFTVEMEFSDEA